MHRVHLAQMGFSKLKHCGTFLSQVSIMVHDIKNMNKFDDVICLLATCSLVYKSDLVMKSHCVHCIMVTVIVLQQVLYYKESDITLLLIIFEVLTTWITRVCERFELIESILTCCF